jgi:diguanylate cyclase (GGDEF)-like protein
VEDNKMLAKAEQAMLTKSVDFGIDIAYNYKEAEARMADQDYFVALLDLNLPDAPNGEIVDLVAKKIPSIVFTASYDDTMRNDVMEKGVVDYFIKEGIEDFKKVVDEVKRFVQNKERTILVVDDSRAIRKLIASSLHRFNYSVLEAEDGKEALAVIDANPEIKVVITDYHMPNMDGFELTKAIRHNRDKDEMAIIGLSSNDLQSISTRFIKYGANDFLKKPFVEEELHVRLAQNIELLEMISQIKNIANKDYMTGIYNRRYFFDAGEKLYRSAKNGHITLTAAMIDIDHFKKVNDTYGHHIGDMAIKTVAGVLDSMFKGSDLVARFGGEEFCVLSPNMQDDHVQDIFDTVRKAIAGIEIKSGEQSVTFTGSIGVSTILGKDLDDMLGVADDMLYRAKENGRNQVRVH